MKNRLFIKTVIIVVACVVTNNAQMVAQDRGHHEPGHNNRNSSFEKGRDHHQRHQNIADFLELNESQLAEFKTLKTSHMKVMLPIKTKLDENHAKLKSLMSDEKPVKSDIDKQIDQIGELETQKLKEKIHFDLQIMSILDEDQRLLFQMHQEKGRENRRL